MRQIVLDTETTGLEVQDGHRVIEIGCVELLNRRPTGRTFHQYLNPQRPIDPGAAEVHGITAEFLEDKPVFPEIAADFVDFVTGAELIIHNAPFDLGFLNHELALLGDASERGPDTPTALEQVCGVLDTLLLARERHPGQRNSLDALCKRYSVDNTDRSLHGALLDARILADLYLVMTGGQASLSLAAENDEEHGAVSAIRRVDRSGLTLIVRTPNAEEMAAHRDKLAAIDKACENGNLWTQFAEFARHDC